MGLIELTRTLVAIPSYVDQGSDERRIGAFIFDYLQGLGTLRVEKQPVENGRFNVIAHDGHPPRLMFCCHTDTVPLSGNWQHDPFAGQIEGDRLYGLGACDMKGGTARLFHALQSFPETQGLFLLFDVDEECYFKGQLLNERLGADCVYFGPGPQEMAHHERTKPHVNVGTIGHIDHGKTMLSSAITRNLAVLGLSKEMSYEDIAKGGVPRAGSEKILTVPSTHLEYETKNRHYSHIDCPGHAD
jgi:hypothetical protein